MKYAILIPSETVEFTDLNDMIEQVYRLTGQKAVIRRQFVVETDSLKLKSMLEEFSGLLTGWQPSKNGAKGPKAQNDPIHMGRASRRIVETGEVYSLVLLKKMISEGTVSDGTVVEDVRGERFVVVSGELIKEPKS